MLWTWCCYFLFHSSSCNTSQTTRANACRVASSHSTWTLFCSAQCVECTFFFASWNHRLMSHYEHAYAVSFVCKKNFPFRTIFFLTLVAIVVLIIATIVVVHNSEAMFKKRNGLKKTPFLIISQFFFSKRNPFRLCLVYFIVACLCSAEIKLRMTKILRFVWCWAFFASRFQELK